LTRDVAVIIELILRFENIDILSLWLKISSISESNVCGCESEGDDRLPEELLLQQLWRRREPVMAIKGQVGLHIDRDNTLSAFSVAHSRRRRRDPANPSSKPA